MPIGHLQPQKISRNIKVAYTQADEIIIKLTAHIDFPILERIVRGRFITHRNLNKIEFKMQEAYYLFRRTELK